MEEERPTEQEDLSLVDRLTGQMPEATPESLLSIELALFPPTKEELKEVGVKPGDTRYYVYRGDVYRESGNIINAKVHYEHVCHLFEAGPSIGRTIKNRKVAIMAQKRLISMGITPKKDYASEALKKGILTKRQINYIK